MQVSDFLASATGWYNQSLAETVLETLDFDPPKGRDQSNDYWYCVEGGTQLVAKRMAASLTTQPTFNKQVTAIKTNLVGKGDIELTLKSTKPDDWDSAKTFTSEIEKRSYFTVFNSTTLGALQRMDLSEANLLYGTKQAIRSLNYGASCKAGIQFDRMWWMEAPWNITQGGIGRTDLPIRVCVYPSYNVGDTIDKPGVLLCSYSWAQDAQRIGTLIDPQSPKNEDELKHLLLSNLAQLHAKPHDDWPYDKLLEYLYKLYKTHHAYDWYHDPNMAGAFAYFGPGQFSQMWPEIIKPNGWLFLIGEASSAHHGWIVGALESAVRAVYQLLVTLHEQVLKGPVERRDFSGYKDAMEFLAGPKGKEHDPDWDLPFVGLPREIPIRQEGTAVGDKVQEMPEDKNVDLTWLTAQVITSFFEMVIEAVKAEAATTGATNA
jgi:monoamine oxidase